MGLFLFFFLVPGSTPYSVLRMVRGTTAGLLGRVLSKVRIVTVLGRRQRPLGTVFFGADCGLVRA